ncbi:MAG: ABC transporter substrate-binding protein [Bacteroidetes bacterium]|nr:ABC transporter substrate-binding protein [Bacteroidota bacterium]
MKNIKILLWLLVAASLINSCTNKPKPQGEVNVPLSADPENLNPIYSGLSESAGTVSGQLFQSLTTIDFKSLKLIPLLAKELAQTEEINEGKYKGGLKLTYEIREEAKWDNGNAITAKDIEFSLKAVKNPLLLGGAAALRAGYALVDSISFDAKNNRKFSLYTKEKDIRTEAAAGDFIVIPQYIYDAKGRMNNFSVSLLGNDSLLAAKKLSDDANLKAFAEEFSSNKFTKDTAGIIGSGPYKLSQWQQGQKVVITKKTNWWGDALVGKAAGFEAYPAKITYRIITDANTTVLALKKGDIDVLTRIPPKDFTEMKADTHVTNRFNLFSPVDLNFTYIAINLKNNALADVNVRRALAGLLDIDNIINKVYYGIALPTVSMENPANTTEYNSAIKRIAYNPNAASKMLDEAGWKLNTKDNIREKTVNGKKLRLQFVLKLNGNPARVSISKIFQEDCKKVGIEITPEVIDLNKLRTDMMKMDYDLAISGSVGVPLPYDPYQSWHTKSIGEGGNFTGFGDEVSDKMIDSIRTTLDTKKRIDIYKRFQALVYERMPYIYIFYSKGRVAINKKFNTEASTLRPGYNPADFKLK